MPTLPQERSPADMTEPSQFPSSFPMLSSQWEVCMVSVLPGDDLVSLSFNFSPSASAFECWNYGQMPPYLALSYSSSRVIFCELSSMGKTFL